MSKKSPKVSMKAFEQQAQQLASVRAQLRISEAQLLADEHDAIAGDAAAAKAAAPPVAAPPPPPSLRAQLAQLKAAGNSYAAMSFVANHADALLAEVDAERKGAA